MIRLGIYQHCKGKFYRVIGIGRDVDHLQVHVIYQELHPGYGIWIRPYDQFIEETELDGKKVKRFTFLQEDVTQPPVCR